MFAPPNGIPESATFSESLFRRRRSAVWTHLRGGTATRSAIASNERTELKNIGEIGQCFIDVSAFRAIQTEMIRRRIGHGNVTIVISTGAYLSDLQHGYTVNRERTRGVYASVQIFSLSRLVNYICENAENLAQPPLLRGWGTISKLFAAKFLGPRFPLSYILRLKTKLSPGSEKSDSHRRGFVIVSLVRASPGHREIITPRAKIASIRDAAGKSLTRGMRFRGASAVTLKSRAGCAR